MPWEPLTENALYVPRSRSGTVASVAEKSRTCISRIDLSAWFEIAGAAFALHDSGWYLGSSRSSTTERFESVVSPTELGSVTRLCATVSARPC